MAFKKKNKKNIYMYECTMTGEKFKRTAEAKNPEELVCVKAYYELNPDEDDRPAAIKKEIEVQQ